MFTGIVEELRPLTGISKRGKELRLEVEVPSWAGEVSLGESISVLGACLTVTSISGDRLAFDLSPETLSRTRFGTLRAGDEVNLERSLRLSDRLGGHLVTGHVDGIGTVRSIHPTGAGAEMTFDVPPELARYLVPKGSIAVDGISLTVASTEGAEFRVAVVPHTLEHTNLGSVRPGAAVHLEADLIGKWIEKLMPGGGGADRSLRDLLGEAGYLAP